MSFRVAIGRYQHSLRPTTTTEERIMSTTQAIPADHKSSVEFIGTSGVVAKYVINSQDEPTAYQWASKQKDILKTSQKSADFKKWRIKVTEILEEKKEE
jgi:hypothetical protein